MRTAKRPTLLLSALVLLLGTSGCVFHHGGPYRHRSCTPHGHGGHHLHGGVQVHAVFHDACD